MTAIGEPHVQQVFQPEIDGVPAYVANLCPKAEAWLAGLSRRPGLWQAHGRSDIPFEQMVNLDYLYVTNWSLWGDVKLVMRTVSVVVRGSGAY